MPPRKKKAPVVTFGSEHEWHSGGDALVRKLYTAGLLPSSQFHSYHCQCDTCTIGSTYKLKAQRDSSCSGEIITQPFHSIEAALPIYSLLESAAVDIDAIPGHSAGLHVHVSRPGVTCPPWDPAIQDTEYWMTLGALFGWLLNHEHWIVQRLASGVFLHNRGFNVDLAPVIREVLSQHSDTVPSTALRLPSMVNRIRLAITDEAGHHAQISTSTSTGVTWEFRFWNSTRSAWRMELAARMSILLTNKEFLTTTTDTVTENDMLAGIELFDPTAAELAARQLDYTRNPCAESVAAFRWLRN